ncbi:MAG: acyltransferase [Faecousia sp.]
MREVRTEEYTVLKAMTTVLVVIAHVTRMYSNGGGAIAMPSNPFLNFVTQFIYVFHMPVFEFVSGAVYSRCILNGKYTDMKRFVGTKVKRLLVPYFVFGIFYVTPVMFLLGLTDQSVKRYLLEGILCNMNSRHLWYLYALFLMLILTRLAQPLLDRHPKIVYLLFGFFTCLACRYWIVPEVCGIMHFAEYYCYFLFGYLFDRKKDQLDRLFTKYWWVSLFGFLAVAGIVRITGEQTFRVLAAFIGILSSYAFTLKAQNFICQWKLYECVRDNSMGIYLFHPMIIYVLFYLGQDFPVSPYGFSCLVFVVAMVLSYCFSKIVKCCKLGFLLGE